MSKKTFPQKLQAFFKLAKAHPDFSGNQLQKIASERGYGLRRTDAQEALKLIKNKKNSYDDVKRKHSKIQAEKAKAEKIKSLKIKKPTILSKKESPIEGVNYTRWMFPHTPVEDPQQVEEATDAGLKNTAGAIKFTERKKKAYFRKHKKEFFQVQYVLYGWVDIYENDQDADDSEEIKGDAEAGGKKIFSGLVNSNAFLDFFRPDPGEMSEALVESWIKNLMKIIQSLNGFIKIRYMQTYISFWEEK